MGTLLWATGQRRIVSGGRARGSRDSFAYPGAGRVQRVGTQCRLGGGMKWCGRVVRSGSGVRATFYLLLWGMSGGGAGAT